MQQTGPSTPAGLSRLAVRGVLWQAISFGLGRVLTLVATVVLARLLTPAEFGLVGLALVFVTFAEYLTDLGVAQALVYFERDERLQDAALTLCAAAGAVLAGAGLLAAPWIADFFDAAEVEPMVRLLSVALLLSALRQVPVALLRRELAFRRLFATELARTLVQGAVSIVLAATGAGAWAIVWGYVAGAAACCVVAWAVVEYRPGLHFVRALTAPVARRLLGYGGPAAAQALLAALIFDIDYLIVGSVLGAEALGLYTLAFRLPQVVIIGVFAVLSAVAFPMFSRARADPARLKRGYLTSVRLQSAYGVAAGVGLFMVAPMVVPVVFGPQWSAAVVPLEALALYAAARSLGSGAVDVYKGIGRPGIGVAVALVRLAVLVPALVLAAHEGGIDAVAWTQAALALAFAVGMQSVAARIVGLGLADLARALRPALALAGGILVGAGLVRWGLTGPDGLRLVAAIVAGAGCGLVALWRLDIGFLQESRALLAAGRGRPAVTT
jgi:PST family polysaccharide transporter